MRRTLLMAVTCGLVIGGAGHAGAATIVSYDFKAVVIEGTIGTIPLGSVVSGTFAYDLDTPPGASQGAFADYATAELSFVVAGMIYTSTGAFTAGKTRVFDDYYSWWDYTDGIMLQTIPDDRTPGDWRSAMIQLYDRTPVPGTALTSLALPATLPAISTFAQAEDSALLEFQQGFGAYFGATIVELSHVTAVPEPSTLALAGIATLAGLVYIRRLRRS